MLQQTKLEQSELLNTQTSADENQNREQSSNTELIHRERVIGTPFSVVGNEESGYFVTLGMYKISPHYPTLNEAKEAVEQDKWDIIINVFYALHQLTQKEQQ